MRIAALGLLVAAAWLAAGSESRGATSFRRLLYVASPGIRNYTEFGGEGVLVFDIAAGHRFLRRIPTWTAPPGQPAENVKGICASARTGLLYVTTPRRTLCLDLRTEKPRWERAYEGGCDRPSLSPDGRVLYMPSFEGSHWLALDALTGEVLARLVTDSGAHNTVYGADGRRVYMGGLKSPYLFVAETERHTIAAKVGPFGGAIRPFTVDHAQSRAYVTVNGLLGFEVGDLRTGRLLHRVEVPGYSQGPVKRHGCPSHGIGLTPDEREVWVCDGFNQALHLFDVTASPPRYLETLRLWDQPGWVTFTIRGDFAYPSTGQVIETVSRRFQTQLRDEAGRAVQSEKLLEIQWEGDRPVAAGDQFGIGRRP